MIDDLNEPIESDNTSAVVATVWSMEGAGDQNASPDRMAPRRAAIYSRRSVTDPEYVSTQRQVSQAIAHCRRCAYSIDLERDVFVDRNRSGATRIGREGLAALLSAVAAGRYDVLVVDQICRIARRLGDALAIAEELRSAGVELELSGSGRIAELEFTLGSLQAQRERISQLELMRLGLRKAAAAGRMIGSSAIYGYRRVCDGSALRIDPTEAGVILRCFEETGRGVRLTELARSLNAEGILAPGGGVWSSRTLIRTNGRGLLQQPLFKGHYVWARNSADPISISRPDLAIVPDALWDTVNTCRRSGAHRGGVKQRLGRILAGVRCSCGATMRAVNSRYGSGFYRCHAADLSADCQNTERYQIADVEREVLLFIRNDLLAPGRLAYWDEVRRRDWDDRRIATEAERSEIAASMREIDGEIARIESISGAIDPYVAERIGHLEYEHHAAARRLDELELPQPSPSNADEAEDLRTHTLRLLAHLPRRLTSEADFQIAARLRALVPCVVIQADDTGPKLHILVGIPGCPKIGSPGLDASPDRWIVREFQVRLGGGLRFAETILRHHAAAEEGAFRPTKSEWKRVGHLFRSHAFQTEDPRLLAEAVIFLATTGLADAMLPERLRDVGSILLAAIPSGWWQEFVRLLGPRWRFLDTKANARRFRPRARRSAAAVRTDR